MIIKITQYEAVSIIEKFLSDNDIKIEGEISIDNDDPYFTTFDFETSLFLLQKKGSKK